MNNFTGLNFQKVHRLSFQVSLKSIGPIVSYELAKSLSLLFDADKNVLLRLKVSISNFYVPGSPYKFHVDSIISGYVTAYGPGLTTGVSGEPSQFTISTKGAGAGGLSMAVEGPSKAEVRFL